MLNKKAAMFGLDARIALAIFGALSVITGAALYKAIGNAKATAILSDLNELGKAWESYYLDTGQNLPLLSTDDTSSSFYSCKTAELAKNSEGVSGWKGPYIGASIHHTDDRFLAHPSYRRYYWLKLTDENTWGDDIAWNTGGKCLSSKKCFVWSVINGVPTDSYAIILDKQIDSGDGPKSGRFRWTDDGEVGKIAYYLQIAPIKNPND